MRILHIIDPGTPGGGACTLQLLSEPMARLSSVHQDVLLIGTERHEALASRCGVRITGRISPPCNQPMLAGFGGRLLRQFMRTHERAARQPYDLIHTWTARSTLLAVIAAPEYKRLATLAVGPVNGILMQVLANRLAAHPATLLATTVNVKRDFIAMGLDPEHIDILPPAVHPEAVEDQAMPRGALRERWGLGDDTYAVGLLSEPMNWADARRAIAVVALGIESGRDFRLVVHPRAERRLDALNWVRKLDRQHAIIMEEELTEPWRCVHGLDAALLIGDDSTTLDLRESGRALSFLVGGGRAIRPMTGVLPPLWAMGSGIPVVAEASIAMQEILEDNCTGMLFPQRDVNAAAYRLVQLYDDKGLTNRICEAARSHVNKNFHVSAYCVRLKEMYERVIEGRLAKVVTDDSEVIELRPHADMRR